MSPRTAAAILALSAVGLAATIVGLRHENIRLQDDNRSLHRRYASLRFEAGQLRRRVLRLEEDAALLDNQLGSVKSRSFASEFKTVQLSRELDDARTRLTAREQHEVALLAELAELRSQQASPPFAAPADSESSARRIRDLEEQLAGLLTRALDAPSADAAFSVVQVGPREAFVVIDYGSATGARPGEILRLLRGTGELARLQISDAREHFSVAQVLPLPRKEQLQTGDLVVLAH
jgi:hypothetical protein